MWQIHEDDFLALALLVTGVANQAWTVRYASSPMLALYLCKWEHPTLLSILWTQAIWNKEVTGQAGIMLDSALYFSG